MYDFRGPRTLYYLAHWPSNEMCRRTPQGRMLVRVARYLRLLDILVASAAAEGENIVPGVGGKLHNFYSSSGREHARKYLFGYLVRFPATVISAKGNGGGVVGGWYGGGGGYGGK